MLSSISAKAKSCFKHSCFIEGLKRTGADCCPDEDDGLDGGLASNSSVITLSSLLLKMLLASLAGCDAVISTRGVRDKFVLLPPGVCGVKASSAADGVVLCRRVCFRLFFLCCLGVLITAVGGIKSDDNHGGNRYKGDHHSCWMWSFHALTLAPTAVCERIEI